jgi:serine/threonine protein kinase
VATHDPTADVCFSAGSELSTASAPTFVAPLGACWDGGLLRPGQRLGDFELVRLLGAGGFGRVFLARQISLDRLVALKVSVNRGHEARTLASLEHEHIVRVFAETVDRDRDLRLLCMQYVPGTTLRCVIEALARRGPQAWSGQAILEAVDELSTPALLVDAAAGRTREFLSRCDFIEAVCWLGACLAEALAHAHRQGVLHRDLKPANILLSSCGRPLLADFNIALDLGRASGKGGGNLLPERPEGCFAQKVPDPFGGTLAYMAPEHIDAFNLDEPTGPEVVDERSDIYSLGVVLFELLTGRSAFPRTAEALESAGSCSDALRRLAADRRLAVPSPRAIRAGTPGQLDRVIRRCLDPEPDGRYQSATELASALEGCRQLRRAKRDMPAAGALTRTTLRCPLFMGFALALFPHVLAAAVNIAYTTLRIAGDLTPSQRRASTQLAVVYNLVVFGACTLAAYWLVAPIRRTLRRLRAGDPVSDIEVAASRRRALALPLWGMLLSCLGWLPGGLVRPVLLDALAPPVSREIYDHCLLSFTIAGLIALTYNVYANQFLVLRFLYPKLWLDGQGWRPQARVDLAGLPGRLRLLQLLAGLVPLTGGLALLLAGDSAHPGSFRLLITALIILGMAGLGLAMHFSRHLSRVVAALTEPEM